MLKSILPERSHSALRIRLTLYWADNFLNGVRKLGIPLNQDLSSGYATGADLVSGSILRLNQSRADARTAYLDPAISRRNLELLTGYTVTRILSGVVGNQTPRNLFQRPGTEPGEVTVFGVEVEWTSRESPIYLSSAFHFAFYQISRVMFVSLTRGH